MKQTEILFPSAERTATSTKTAICKYRAALIFIHVSSVTDTPSVVFTVKGHDPVSDTSYDILESAAITGTGLTVLRINDRLTGSANTIAKDMMPEAISITATHADADSITYSVAMQGVG